MPSTEFDSQRKVLEFVGGEEWDTALWSKDRNDGGNLTVRIRVKVCFRSVEMRTGPATGYYQEEDDRFGTVGMWERMMWEAWKREYKEVLNDFWSGKFWLETPDDYEELNYANIKPNVRCDLSVDVTNAPGGAHLTFNVIRVPDYRVNRAFTGGPGFTGWLADVGRGSDTESEERLVIIHDIAHLFSLPHQDRRYAGLNRYYQLQDKVMGTGSLVGIDSESEVDPEVTGALHRRLPWMALPWQLAMEKHTGIAARRWKVSTRRLGPKFLNEMTHPGKKPKKQ